MPIARAGRPVNIVKDAKTVAAMIRIYCHDRHGTPDDVLCESCAALDAYADLRLEKCPFGARKTTCRACPIHCYRPAERALMKDVMRYAGPRMLWAHPLLTIRHLWLERKGPPHPSSARPAPASAACCQSAAADRGTP